MTKKSGRINTVVVDGKEFDVSTSDTELKDGDWNYNPDPVQDILDLRKAMYGDDGLRREILPPSEWAALSVLGIPYGARLQERPIDITNSCKCTKCTFLESTILVRDEVIYVCGKGKRMPYWTEVSNFKWMKGVEGENGLLYEKLPMILKKYNVTREQFLNDVEQFKTYKEALNGGCS
jgi:hypothetical protein